MTTQNQHSREIRRMDTKNRMNNLKNFQNNRKDMNPHQKSDPRREKYMS